MNGLDINKNVARRPSIQRARIARMSQTLVTLVVIAAGTAGLVYAGRKVLQHFLHHPDFVIRKVYVTSNRTLTPAEVLATAGITTGMNLYATALEPIAARLERNPDIARVEITKAHPDQLNIKVIEREPVAVVMTGGTAPYVPVDATGVMLSDRKMEFALELPKVTGLETFTYKPGEYVRDQRLHTALSFVAALRHMPGPVFLDVKSIDLTQPNLVTLRSATIDRIHLGTRYTHEDVLRLLTVVSDLRFKRLNAASIDLRFADVIVMPRVL
jgi:cell division septal protein FtsQ